MKVLIWNAPWPSQGSLLFFKNCFVKHLALQANTLASCGCDVEVLVPEQFRSEVGALSSSVKQIHLSFAETVEALGSIFVSLKDLYGHPSGAATVAIAELLRNKLAARYDAILVWENPVPFLARLYPDALIVHQMPGAFSRPPYPHTVTFDPIGLYRDGAFHVYSADILAEDLSSQSEVFVNDFATKVRNAINEVQPFRLNEILNGNRYESLALLPLQTSGHYAFEADTGFTSQLELLTAATEKIDRSTGILVTQYVSAHVRDTVLDKDVHEILKGYWSNLIYDQRFDLTPSVSQYLLPFADRVISSSSSIAIQAMVWQREITVLGNTFLAPYATAAVEKSAGSRQIGYARALSFLLERGQPLASRVTTDGKFLVDLLTEMKFKRAQGRIGLELMPRFTEIDPNYADELAASFTVGRAARSLRSSNPILNAETDELAKFKRAVARSEIKCISFDVFDTLVNRAVETPADAYALLESEVLCRCNRRLDDFARVRLGSELAARDETPDGEISLEQIYGHVQRHYGLMELECAELMQLEIETEKRIIAARPFGRKLWEVALASGKPIIVVSDMYLSKEVVADILKASGYSGYSDLFVSSAYNARKKDGALFDIVLQRLSLRGDAVLHIGDNKVADIEQASSKGIQPFRTPRAIDRMRANGIYKSLFDPRVGAGEKSRSVIAGLIASRLFDVPVGMDEKNSLFAKSPFRLGYAALGPLVAGYTLWLGRQAVSDNVSKLYFLSREGWLLHECYKILKNSAFDAVESVYLYASRRAVRVAAIQCEADIFGLASQPYTKGVRLSELLRSRFGLKEQDLPSEILRDAGFASPDAILDTDSGTKISFSRLCALLSDRILSSAKREREPYISYLQSVGLTGEGSPAVVDIGWKANMQGSMGALLGRPMGGYYYATLQGAERWLQNGHNLSAYAGNFVVPGYAASLIGNRHLMEFLICHTDRSLERMESTDSGYIPVARPEANHAFRRLFIEEVHRGALEFVTDLRNRFGSLLNHVHIDPSTAERVMANFITTPTATDAALLRDVVFEDSFGGVTQKYIISTEREQSVWKQGFDSFTGKKMDRPAPKKLQAKGVEVAVDNPKSQLSGNEVNPSTLLKMERGFVKLLSNDRKYRKYLKSRRDFFADSRNPITRGWGTFFGIVR